MNTTIESITILSNGVVIASLKKRPIDPYSEEPAVRGEHRLSYCPGDDVSAAAMEAANTSLAGIGVLPIDAESWSRLTTQCAAAWTEEVVAAFKASIAVA